MCGRARCRARRNAYVALTSKSAAVVRRAFSGISTFLRAMLAAGRWRLQCRRDRGAGTFGAEEATKAPAVIAGASSSWGCDQAGIIRGFVTLAGRGATNSSNTSVKNTAIVAIVRPIAA